MRWGCFFIFVSECVEIGVCLRNRVHNLAVVGLRIGGWVGVIDSLRVGLRHLGAYVQAVKKVTSWACTIIIII